VTGPGGSSSAVTAPALPAGVTLPTDRMLVMGILNVTPDSFSDGGRWADPGAALAHAEQMVADGADLVDVGGESTRPHSHRLSGEQEWERIGTVVGALAGRAGLPVSVDTLHADTARRAADAGAAIINDVSGGCFDPRMARAVAATECAYVVQHWRGFPGDPHEDFDYGADVVGTLLAELDRQVGAVLDAGVPPGRILVDPGLGFSVRSEQSWEIVDSLGRLRDLGYPVLIGASRKRFLGDACGGDRDAATLAVSRRARDAGMWAVRVHDVAPHVRLVRGVDTIGTAGRERA